MPRIAPIAQLLVGMGESDDCKGYIAAAEHHHLNGELLRVRHRMVDLC